MSENTRIGGSILATWTLTLITVCLRYFARTLSKAGFWYDDWLIVPATVLATAICFILAFWMTDQGLGQPMGDESPYQEGLLLHAIFIIEICWGVVIWIVKYSILAFYWRLFSASRRSTRIIIWTLAAFVTCWGISVVLLTIFQCVPVGSIWSITDGARKCYYDNFQLFVGLSIPHILTDVVLLGIPVPLIWNLHLYRSRKVVLTAVFALGIFVTAVSIVRLTYLLNFRNEEDYLTFSHVNIFIWTSVEVNVSIICACLPSLGPILPFVSEKLKLLRNRKSTHKRGSQLLMDILPARKPASSPILPLSRKQSWSDGPNPMLDSSTIVEMEAKNPRAPELDAEAPGPHILEIGTLEPVLKMESRRSTAELEGWSRHIPELEGGHGHAVEL